MKKKPRFYFCETLKENFWFFIGWNEVDVIKYLRNYFSLIGVSLENRAGITIDFGKAKVIYINKNQRKVKLYAVLAHECVHAANMAFASRNITPANDELLAYYVEVLMIKALDNGN